MKQFVRTCLFLGLAVCGACLANARVWTIDGTTKVKAEFSGIIGDTVFLSKADGSSQKVPLASLSAEDRAFIKNSERTTSSVVASSPPPSSTGVNGTAFADYSNLQAVDMGPGGSKPITVRRIVINIEPGTVIGKAYWEPSGVQTETLTAPPAAVASEQCVTITREELKKAHYNLPGADNLIFGDDESAKARYELGAQVSDLGIDVYVYSNSWPNPPTRQIQGHITVDWKVYDTLAHKIVYTHTINTGFRDNQSDAPSVYAMFRKNLRQLLANPGFTAFMKPGNDDENESAKGSAFSSPLELAFFHREKALVLPADFPAVLDGVVTIKSGAVTGAGFIITEDGYALTAAHVVSGLKTVSVCLHNGLVLDADVVRVVDGADVALIKLPGTSHKALELAADEPDVGIDVFAVGDPTGEKLSSSVSKGVVSGKREIDGRKYVQTDASINPGNSGGPLISKNGRVLGIISKKFVGVGFEGLAFAVPVSEAIARLNLKSAPVTAK